jgi:anti-anti-sigma factor
VSSVARGSGCVITVSGELTVATADEFTARVTNALAGSDGPVLFDMSGLVFADCQGARALARAVGAARPREARLHGCTPVMLRVAVALGLDLPHQVAPASAAPARPQPEAHPRTLSRGEAIRARTREAESTMRQTALHTSEVMARLADTYSRLALNAWYRTQRKSEDRGRLLALSGRAHNLSRQYLRHADSEAG